MRRWGSWTLGPVTFRPVDLIYSWLIYQEGNVIPGSKPKIEAQFKVRVGKKTERGYPTSLDHFVSEAFNDEPKSMLVRFVHPEVEEAFSSGLEWWAAKNKQNYLACFTKDGGDNPVAYRLPQMLDEGQAAIGPATGSGRLPIACPARDCPHLKEKRCKPMARLVFCRKGSPVVLQFDTKSWNSIEKITGALQHARGTGPLNTPDRWFRLSVEMVKKGTNHFPMVTIKEEFADDPQTAQAIAAGESIIAAEQTEGDNRTKLIAAIRARGSDPRDPKVVEWVQKLGIDTALAELTKANNG